MYSTTQICGCLDPGPAHREDCAACRHPNDGPDQESPLFRHRRRHHLGRGMSSPSGRLRTLPREYDPRGSSSSARNDVPPPPRFWWRPDEDRRPLLPIPLPPSQGHIPLRKVHFQEYRRPGRLPPDGETRHRRRHSRRRREDRNRVPAPDRGQSVEVAIRRFRQRPGARQEQGLDDAFGTHVPRRRGIPKWKDVAHISGFEGVRASENGVGGEALSGGHLHDDRGGDRPRSSHDGW